MSGTSHFLATLLYYHLVTNNIPLDPPSRALTQSRISLRGDRTGADDTSPRHSLHAGLHQRLLSLEISHTCSMVRYIILRKHLLLIPPIIKFHNNLSSTWFLQREGYLRHVKQTAIIAPCKPPPTARTEEEECEEFSDFEYGAATSTITQNYDTGRVGHAIRIFFKLKLVPVIPARLSADYCPKTLMD